MPVFASSCLCITMARLSAQLSTRSFRTSRGAYSYFICVSFSLPHFPSFTLCFFAAIPLNLLGPLPSNSSTVLFLRSCRAQQRAKNGSQSFLFCSLILPFPHHTLSDLVPFRLTPESQSCTALLLLWKSSSDRNSAKALLGWLLPTDLPFSVLLLHLANLM